MSAMQRLLTKIAIISITVLFAMWWAWTSFADWKTSLIEQGKTECRTATDKAADEALKAENAQLLAQVELQTRRAEKAEQANRERDELADSQQDELIEEETSRTVAATPTCPAPTLSDRAVNIYNAPLVKATKPEKKP